MTNAWLSYKIEMRDELRSFAKKILKLSDVIPDTNKGNVLCKQIIRSGTSMYANYRAALRGRSKREFFTKLSIAVEEADETEMWLDLIITSNIIENEMIHNLHKESLKLLKKLSSMRKRLSD